MPAPTATVPQALQLAIQHYQAGRLIEAEELCRKILAVNPDHADALHLLGIIAQQTGQFELAIQSLQRAVALQPDLAEAHNNLGVTLAEQGRLGEAAVAYRRALALQPQHAEAYNNIGNALQEGGQLDEAIACYRQALDRRPAYPEARNNLGNALLKQGHTDDAIAEYERALALNPGFGDAYLNLGHARRDRGELEKAIAAYRSAIPLLPVPSDADSALLLTLHYLPGLESAAISEEHRRWNRRVNEPLARRVTPHTNQPGPDRRLRIGYVSPDFCDHVAGRNLMPLFRYHDHRHFELFCYSGVAQPDRLTQALRQHSDAWCEVKGLADEALAERIRRDEVDILVDLSQHTAHNRLPVFARRPAPVQVSFVGYPASTGLEAIGYRISDRWLESGALEMGVRRSEIEGALPTDLPSPICDLRPAEQVLLLDSFWCYDPCGIEIAVNPLPAQASGRIVFGSLNNFCKINDPLLRLWVRVLGRVHDSRLILVSPLGSHRQRTLDFLTQEGIASHRVEFVARTPRREYLALYHRLDIVLDPFPYNGHTTSLDALWMGVPVVSLAGRTSVSRAGLSILSNLGLPEWVAHTEEDYVRIAADLAGDLPRLAAIRATLRARLETSVLMDAPHFARQIETTYRAMWRQWCASQPT